MMELSGCCHSVEYSSAYTCKVVWICPFVKLTVRLLCAFLSLKLAEIRGFNKRKLSTGGKCTLVCLS